MAFETRALADPGMPPPVDLRIGALAGAQGGVVSRGQLAAAGLTADGVLHRVQVGRLHRIHPRVYAVGHRAVSRLGCEWAAVLATDGVLSHRSAGAKLGVLTWNGRVEVAARRGRKPLAGVVVHTTRSLHPDDVVLDAASGLRHTSWARTTIDMAELYDVHEMTRYLERSEIERRYDGLTLAAAMGRANGRRGLKVLVPALNLGYHLRPQGTRSEIEELLLRVVREGDFDEVHLNRWMQVGERWIMADAWFPKQRLVIELDSRWHDTVGARERDADRDRDTETAGVRVARLRKRDVTHDRVAAELGVASERRV